MRKIIYLVFIFTLYQTKAQNTLVAKVVPATYFSEQNSAVDNDTVTELHFSKNFKKKYAIPEFIYEEKTPEKNAWDRLKEWLSSLVQNIFKISNKAAAQDITITILKIISLLIIVFAVYKIIKALLNKEGQWIFGKNKSKQFVTEDPIELQIKTADFEKLVRQATTSGQNRLTLRYYYLWLLQKMSQKQIIDWDIEKTNADYLYEIKDAAHKERFAYLSYLYDYSWYGEFEMNQETFENAKLMFEKTIKNLGS